MHGSEILVSNGQRVRPDDYIGYTGAAGAGGRIHLHIGARDRAGNQVDPRIAVLGLTDYYMAIFRDAQRFANNNRYRTPKLLWYEFK